MNWLKIALTCLIFLLAACGAGRNSSTPQPRAGQFERATCVPESELLARGIVGGTQVQPSDNDSKLVAMLYSNNSICTAVIIADNALLTAAHCLAGDASNTKVIFHPSISCESGFNVNQHAVGVKKLIKHENYSADLSDGGINSTADIGLVILNEPVPDGYSIFNLASMPTSSAGLHDLYLYGYGEVGWEQGGEMILRRTSIKSDRYLIDIPNKKVVVRQNQGTGICQGDSGGPAFIIEGGELKILGINSYVSADTDTDMCADTAVETLAPAYKDWIEEKILENKKEQVETE